MREVRNIQESSHLPQDLDELQQRENKWMMKLNPRYSEEVNMWKSENMLDFEYLLGLTRCNKLQESDYERKLKAEIMPDLFPKYHIKRLVKEGNRIFSQRRKYFQTRLCSREYFQGTLDPGWCIHHQLGHHTWLNIENCWRRSSNKWQE